MASGGRARNKTYPGITGCVIFCPQSARSLKRAVNPQLATGVAEPVDHFLVEGVALDAADFFHLGLASKQDALLAGSGTGPGEPLNCLTYWLNQVAEPL